MTDVHPVLKQPFDHRLTWVLAGGQVDEYPGDDAFRCPDWVDGEALPVAWQPPRPRAAWDLHAEHLAALGHWRGAKITSITYDEATDIPDDE